jgi:hypothetical protein
MSLWCEGHYRASAKVDLQQHRVMSRSNFFGLIIDSVAAIATCAPRLSYSLCCIIVLLFPSLPAHSSNPALLLDVSVSSHQEAACYPVSPDDEQSTRHRQRL